MRGDGASRYRALRRGHARHYILNEYLATLQCLSRHGIDLPQVQGVSSALISTRSQRRKAESRTITICYSADLTSLEPLENVHRVSCQRRRDQRSARASERTPRRSKQQRTSMAALLTPAEVGSCKKGGESMSLGYWRAVARAGPTYSRRRRRSESKAS
jgi:hypothetical protein